ncbi:MAG: tRNA lysidine(34) synthetase TilS [Clostridia bacterium]|nr:tRNA lysidine(34) synthetase TilS [Clostridia bacterium]
MKRGRIIRPILFLSRSEILQYAERHQVSFREDSTNDDTDYTRNRIRHTILPEMERMNPNIVDSLSRLAASCEEATGLIRQLVPASDRETDYRSWNIAALKVRLSEAYAALSGSSLCHYHIDAICDAVYSEKNCEISLPKNWTAVCRDGKVGFEQPAGKAGEISPEVFEGTLVFGANDVNSFCTVILSETEIDAASAKRFVNNLSTEIFLRKDGIHGTLRYRKREPGDHITEFGVSKKLKKVLNERKIPLSVRPYIPVIYDDSGICCVPFVATADRVFSKHSADSFRLYVSIDATDPLKEGDFR